MRIRTIKPEFWTHEGMAQLSDFARLLALALLNYADDEGLFLAHPNLIRGQLFPFADDSKNIPRTLHELSCAGWIELGNEEGGRAAGRIVNFTKHQRIDKPQASKIKGFQPFLSDSKNIPRTILEQSPLDQGSGIRDQGMELSPEIRPPTNGHPTETDLFLSPDGDDVVVKPEAPNPEKQFLARLWAASPKQSRERSSKKEVAQEWQRTKLRDRPTYDGALAALEAWKRSDKWTKENGQYAEALDKWIKNRQWENVPEAAAVTHARDPNMPAHI